MASGILATPSYFDRPFSVRDVNGRPLEVGTNSSNGCTQPRNGAHVLTDFGHVHAHAGQRQQRQSTRPDPNGNEANYPLSDKEVFAMDTSGSRAMLKRKHSDTSWATPATKRPRTLSEPHYPFHEQPNEALCLSELNPLHFGIYQTPEAFQYTINGLSRHSNPLHVVEDSVRQHEPAQQLSLCFEKPSITSPTYPYDSPPSSSDLELTDDSSEVLVSVETPLSSQISSDECNRVWDRSRGPSFSPITTKGSSPAIENDEAVVNDIDLHSFEGSNDSSELHTCDLDLPNQTATASILEVLPADHMEELDSHSSQTSETPETTRDSSLLGSSAAKQHADDTHAFSIELEDQTIPQVHANPMERQDRLLKLRFADKAAFAGLVESLQAVKNLPAQHAATAENRMDVDESRSVIPDADVTEQLEPAHDSTEDRQFVEKVKVVLKAQGKWKTRNVARRSACRIQELLEVAEPPNVSEALFLTGDEAAEYVKTGSFFEGPIITQDQQPLPLQTTTQFLNEYYDDEATVWIQDPAVLLSRKIPHAREITIGQLKTRFNQTSSIARIPWNCLEMATHVEDGLRPAFLNNEDCRLLTKLKLPSSADSASRRGYEPGWKEVEKWALLAQGGALTEPHQDSHGYATYITVNQGIMGFGWLSKPTDGERRAWRAKPEAYTDGRWRYVVLRAGQTVYFPSGTVHFVFRLASSGDTLAFGGHVLRCSQIVRWVECMLEEQQGPNITNEYLSVSAPAYLDRVEKFVKQALTSGQEQRWGGTEAIERFLELKERFMSCNY